MCGGINKNTDKYKLLRISRPYRDSKTLLTGVEIEPLSKGNHEDDSLIAARSYISV